MQKNNVVQKMEKAASGDDDADSALCTVLSPACLYFIIRFVPVQ